MADTKSDNELYVAIWNKAVETQMHFNEMSVKSRQLGLTFVAAALGIGIVLLSRGEDFSLFFQVCGVVVTLHIAVPIVAGAILALRAVRELDLNVYHKMLRGAVTFGEDFEREYMKKVFELDKGMTQAISHFSRYEDAMVSVADSGRYRYGGEKKVTAYDKVKGFYKKTTLYLAGTAAVLFLLTNIANWENPKQRAPVAKAGIVEEIKK